MDYSTCKVTIILRLSGVGCIPDRKIKILSMLNILSHFMDLILNSVASISDLTFKILQL